MRKFWFLALVMPLAFLTPVKAEAVLCPSSTTFEALATLGSCTIGDKTFSGFMFLGGSIDDSEITAVTVNNGNTAIGFVFGLDLTAFAGEREDVRFLYNVTAPSATITDVHLIQTASATGVAMASVGETICIGSTLPTCAGGEIRTLQSSILDAEDVEIFSATNVLGVQKDIIVAAQACPNGGSCLLNFASLSIVENTVSQTVPEPATLLLLGSGLLGAAMWSRNKFRSK